VALLVQRAFACSFVLASSRVEISLECGWKDVSWLVVFLFTFRLLLKRSLMKDVPCELCARIAKILCEDSRHSRYMKDDV
jgi:hypothetical protein